MPAAPSLATVTQFEQAVAPHNAINTGRSRSGPERNNRRDR